MTRKRAYIIKTRVINIKKTANASNHKRSLPRPLIVKTCDHTRRGVNSPLNPPLVSFSSRLHYTWPHLDFNW